MVQFSSDRRDYHSHDQQHDHSDCQNANTDMSPAPRQKVNYNSEHWRNRRMMAWLALIGLFVVTGLAMFAIPEGRLQIILELIIWFDFSMASIVGAYMGFTTWAQKKDRDQYYGN